MIAEDQAEALSRELQLANQHCDYWRRCAAKWKEKVTGDDDLRDEVAELQREVVRADRLLGPARMQRIAENERLRNGIGAAVDALDSALPADS